MALEVDGSNPSGHTKGLSFNGLGSLTFNQEMGVRFSLALLNLTERKNYENRN